MEAYECGIKPTPIPFGGVKIPVRYYVTAMLFIVFDIEIVFLYPWAVTALPAFPCPSDCGAADIHRCARAGQ